ncbi:hypothetical protein BJP40_19970 [Streptomyces sp. CC53]|uniref:WhiB family transcriptional regulator n=1 Tax=unclassified Streptomyces TaxID=2593676 RepID=UPI0008DD04D8|nr:hypothetical protein BJP40_19970 [Streptomyces sp. CC53]
MTTRRSLIAAPAPRTANRAYDWRDEGACRRGVHPELFFPVGSTVPALAQTREAKLVCRSCPVIAQCAVWALTHRREEGVWGGLDESDRRSIHRTHGARLRNPAYVRAVVDGLLGNAVDLKLTEAYELRTAEVEGGHVRWTVTTRSVTIAARTYSPMQLAFAVGYGRLAVGAVRARCGVRGCVAPEHLWDERMRLTQKRRAAA